MRKLVNVIVIGAAFGAVACQRGERETREQGGTAQQEQPGRAGVPPGQDETQQQQQPGQTPPGQGQMGQGQTEQGQTGQTQPGQGQMGRTQPGQGQMGQTQPGQGQMGQTQPGQGQMGQTVTLQGEIKDSYGTQVFKVDLEQGGEVIVVTPRPMQEMKEGSQVAVSGQMQQGGVAQIERDLGVDLTPEAEREIQQGNVIVARSMEMQPGQPGQQQQMPQ